MTFKERIRIRKKILIILILRNEKESNAAEC